MRIPILKIFAVSCVRPKSWIEIELNWAWIKLQENMDQNHQCFWDRHFYMIFYQNTDQFTFISLVLIFPSSGNLKEYIQQSNAAITVSG